MILLVFVAVLWVVVLAPSLYAAFGSAGESVPSITFTTNSNFLEHAGPKLVAPAYRLRGRAIGGELLCSSVVAAQAGSPARRL